MAAVFPFTAIRYRDPALDKVLAPPYDVISPDQRQQLYRASPYNIVRVDFCDEPDPYAAAAKTLEHWLAEGILQRDAEPAFYVLAHRFPVPDGETATRWGMLARVRALPWDQADVRPHERTLSGPKEDRLQLMRATGAQSSPIFCMAAQAPGFHDRLLASEAQPPLAAAEFAGELGTEYMRLWRVCDLEAIAALRMQMESAHLYIADGHHRFETGAAYAQERRAATPAAPPDSDFAYNLVYVCAAGDPALAVLPIHRLVAPAPGVPSSLGTLRSRLSGEFSLEPAATLRSARQAAAEAAGTAHVYVVVASDGLAVLSLPRTAAGSDPTAQLDVTVLENRVFRPLGIGAAEVAGGAIGYSRSREEVLRRVGGGEAALGFLLQPGTVDDVLRVADAGEVMPQKSTYFYPKVPTGLVLYPLDAALGRTEGL